MAPGSDDPTRIRFEAETEAASQKIDDLGFKLEDIGDRGQAGADGLGRLNTETERSAERTERAAEGARNLAEETGRVGQDAQETAEKTVSWRDRVGELWQRLKDGASAALEWGRATLASGEDVEKAKPKVDSFREGLGELKKQLLELLAAHELLEFAKEALEAFSKLDAIQDRLRTTLHNQEVMDEELAHAEKVANALGLENLKLADSYSRLIAVGLPAGANLTQLRAILEGAAVAATALGGGTDEVTRVLDSLSNAFARGEITGRQLVLQIGQAMPGALGRLAKEFGFTSDATESAQKKFTDYAKSVDSAHLPDFLARIGAALRRAFAEDARAAADGLEEQKVRIENAFEKIKLAAASGFIQSLTDALGDAPGKIESTTEAVEGLGRGAGQFVGILRELLVGSFGLGRWLFGEFKAGLKGLTADWYVIRAAVQGWNADLLDTLATITRFLPFSGAAVKTLREQAEATRDSAKGLAEYAASLTAARDAESKAADDQLLEFWRENKRVVDEGKQALDGLINEFAGAGGGATGKTLPEWFTKTGEAATAHAIAQKESAAAVRENSAALEAEIEVLNREAEASRRAADEAQRAADEAAQRSADADAELAKLRGKDVLDPEDLGRQAELEQKAADARKAKKDAETKASDASLEALQREREAQQAQAEAALEADAATSAAGDSAEAAGDQAAHAAIDYSALVAQMEATRDTAVDTSVRLETAADGTKRITDDLIRMGPPATAAEEALGGVGDAAEEAGAQLDEGLDVRDQIEALRGGAAEAAGAVGDVGEAASGAASGLDKAATGAKNLKEGLKPDEGDKGDVLDKLDKQTDAVNPKLEKTLSLVQQIRQEAAAISLGNATEGL